MEQTGQWWFLAWQGMCWLASSSNPVLSFNMQSRDQISSRAPFHSLGIKPSLLNKWISDIGNGFVRFWFLNFKFDFLISRKGVYFKVQIAQRNYWLLTTSQIFIDFLNFILLSVQSPNFCSVILICWQKIIMQEGSELGESEAGVSGLWEKGIKTRPSAMLLVSSFVKVFSHESNFQKNPDSGLTVTSLQCFNKFHRVT
jgi:hypothetical protein